MTLVLLAGAEVEFIASTNGGASFSTSVVIDVHLT
jgi:hypothetical protein